MPTQEVDRKNRSSAAATTWVGTSGPYHGARKPSPKGLGGSIVLTWGRTDQRLQAIAQFYGVAPKPLEASRRLCPVVGSWPGHDFTTKAAGLLETELTGWSVGCPRRGGLPADSPVHLIMIAGSGGL